MPWGGLLEKARPIEGAPTDYRLVSHGKPLGLTIGGFFVVCESHNMGFGVPANDASHIMMTP